MPIDFQLRQWVMLGSLLISSVLAAAPVQTPAATQLATVPPMPSAAQVLAVPEAVLARLEVEVIKAKRSPQARLRRLVEFMLDAEGLGLVYDNSRTRTVTEAILEGKANCLSFTLAFMELSRRAGFHTRMMESEQALTWALEDRTLFVAGHVSAYVRFGRHRFEVNFDPNAPLLRRDQHTVSDDRAMAHYYNNRAAELMAQGERAAAQEHFDEALKLDATMVSTLNNQGVLLMRAGDLAAAEVVYAQALAEDSDNLSVMANLINLYRLQGRLAKAEELEQQLEQSRAKDPLHHFLIGVFAERSGDYTAALGHFQTAVKLDRREALFEQALARVHLALGNNDDAQRHQKRALRLSERSGRALPDVEQSL